VREAGAVIVFDGTCVLCNGWVDFLLRHDRAGRYRFAAMQGATNGDFTHGLIHPDQMIGGRLLVPGSAHATPIPGLYLCGASCHPGPGVTFLPGYGAAYEVAEVLERQGPDTLEPALPERRLRA